MRAMERERRWKVGRMQTSKSKATEYPFCHFRFQGPSWDTSLSRFLLNVFSYSFAPSCRGEVMSSASCNICNHVF